MRNRSRFRITLGLIILSDLTSGFIGFLLEFYFIDFYPDAESVHYNVFQHPAFKDLHHIYGVVVLISAVFDSEPLVLFFRYPLVFFHRSIPAYHVLKRPQTGLPQRYKVVCNKALPTVSGKCIHGLSESFVVTVKVYDVCVGTFENRLWNHRRHEGIARNVVIGFGARFHCLGEKPFFQFFHTADEEHQMPHDIRKTGYANLMLDADLPRTKVPVQNLL